MSQSRRIDTQAAGLGGEEAWWVLGPSPARPRAPAQGRRGLMVAGRAPWSPLTR